MASNIAYTLGLAAVGADVTIWPLAKIIAPERMTIGDSVIIDDFVFLMGGSATTIGSFVHIASFVGVTGGGEFVIEDFAGVASGTKIFTGNDDYSGGSLTGPTVPSPYRVPSRSFVRIRRHAVIGASSVILPGVVIGEGAVVGANSFVRKDCEPWTMYFGSPARPIKPRPRARILELEAQLRRDLYDATGRYIPKADRR